MERRYSPCPLSRLNGEHGLWVRYTTNIVTESDLWMSALLSHSGSSFKVFHQCCICQTWCRDAAGDKFRKAWWQQRRPFYYYYLSSPPFCLHSSHSSTWFLCEIFCFSQHIVLTAARIPARSAGTSPALCLFHTWVAFIFSSHCLPLSQPHTNRPMCTLTHSLLFWNPDRRWRTALGLLRFHYFLSCSTVLPALTCVPPTTRRNTCKMPYLAISVWQLSKVIFNYASVDSALEEGLCSTCLGQKHGKMQDVCVCVCATFEHDYVLQMVCKFSRGWGWIPQINSWQLVHYYCPCWDMLCWW